jgi:hypothetical protein
MFKISCYGFCPELNKEMEIVVDVEEKRFLRESTPKRAKRCFTCQYNSFNGCQTEDN